MAADEAALRASASAANGPVRALGRAVAAEWTKILSVRSTWWSLAAGAALTVLFVLTYGLSAKASLRAGVPEVTVVSAIEMTAGAVLFLAQFAAIALAALASAGEFATGNIRSTLQAVPHRGRMLAAKGMVVLPGLFCTGAGLGLLGTALAVPVLDEAARPVAAGEVVRMAAGLGAYLAFAGVLTVGIGTTLRSVAGTLTVAFLLLTVVPMALQNSGLPLLMDVSEWFPTAAATHLVSSGGSGPYGPGVALLVLAGWAGAGLLLATASLGGRDA